MFTARERAVSNCKTSVVALFFLRPMDDKGA